MELMKILLTSTPRHRALRPRVAETQRETQGDTGDGDTEDGSVCDWLNTENRPLRHRGRFCVRLAQHREPSTVLRTVLRAYFETQEECQTI